MKAIFTCFSFVVLTVVGYSQRQPFPTSNERTGFPGTFPKTASPPPAATTTSPDYDQLVKTGDTHFQAARYDKAIEQYNLALSIHREQYPKDQIARAEALKARTEKEETFRREKAAQLELAREQESIALSEKIKQKRIITGKIKYIDSTHRIEKVLIAQSLKENNLSKSAFICDVSGSMEIHQPLVLQWLKEQFASDSSALKRVVIFNDNGNKVKQTENPNAVTGVYSYPPISYEYIEHAVGVHSNEFQNYEEEENVFTALLKAQTDAPECENLVLINDNHKPWDIKLAPKITKPTHIIITNWDFFVEPVFVNLARDTKGSLSFMGKKYENLDQYGEGDWILINDLIYVVSNGKFVIDHYR